MWRYVTERVIPGISSFIVKSQATQQDGTIFFGNIRNHSLNVTATEDMNPQIKFSQKS
jgi:hypothetical protein